MLWKKVFHSVENLFDFFPWCGKWLIPVWQGLGGWWYSIKNMQQGFYQSQQLRQEMKLAPQVIQALQFLQAPVPELHELIRAELETNPLLEEKAGDGIAPLAREPLAAGGASEPGSMDDLDAHNDFDADDYTREVDRLEQLMAEADAPLRRGLDDYAPPASEAAVREAERRHQFFMDSLTAPPTLYSVLEGQLEKSGLDGEQRAAGRYIIGSLDDNGWLDGTLTLDDIARESGTGIEAVEQALAAIQDFDPAGVGARDLEECLLIQLRRAGHGEESAAGILVRRHLEEIATASPRSLARKTGLRELEVAEAIALIGGLDPKPGGQVGGDASIFVTPEAEIRATADGGYAVDLLRDGLPRLKLNAEYVQMLEDPGTGEEAQSYLRERRQSGEAVIRGLRQRGETIRRVTEEIAAAQGAFFEAGISRLKPMTMGEVAERMGVHETTVGRAVAGKYIRTPQGVFELRFFFTSGIQTAGGGMVSNEAVKEALAKLIEREDVRKPLSDQAITDRLREQGYELARRTVAKYREQMDIPPAYQRK